MENELVRNAFSVSTDKQQNVSRVTGDYTSGRAEKKAFTFRSLFVLNDS
jgi:hypothetical protein